MRSAGCAINDYADRHVDPHVARTKPRPLAAGHISPGSGGVCGIGIGGLLLELQLNTLTITLSLVAMLLAATYPFMKRFHHLPQVHLGLRLPGQSRWPHCRERDATAGGVAAVCGCCCLDDRL